MFESAPIVREVPISKRIFLQQFSSKLNRVLELLPNPDDENDEDQAVHLSPEEQLLRDLVNLAVTSLMRRCDVPIIHEIP
jgi:hypothetical protein